MLFVRAVTKFGPGLELEKGRQVVHASVGDWLIVKTRGEHERRGVILAARPDGSPPYTVRWTDDGHQTVVFPGPDAIVMTPADLAEAERVENKRIDEVQSAIIGGPPES